MDQVLGFIQHLSPVKKDHAQLKKVLLKERGLILKHSNQIDHVLELLEQQLRSYTLGYTFLLAQKVKREVEDHNHFIRQTINLIYSMDPEQAEHVHPELSAVCQKFVTSLILADRPLEGILPLQNVIRIMQGSRPNLLTTAHGCFVLLCVKAKCFNVAVSLLDTPIYEVDPRKNGLTSLDYLLYHYYGGIVWIALKKFEKALEFFQLALTAPSKSLSNVQIESYQKYILVSLIVHGEVVPLPKKITSPVVIRNIDRHASLYTMVSRGFQRGMDDLRRVIEEHHEELKKDRNFGLAKQTITAFVRRKIRRLTDTYMILSLSEIAESAQLESPAQAERHVLDMIKDRAIYATINQKEGIVSFHEDNEQYDTALAVEKLDKKIREAADIERRLRKADEDVQLDPKYIKKTMGLSGGQNQKRGPSGPSGPSRGGPSGSYEDQQLQQALLLSKLEQ